MTQAGVHLLRDASVVLERNADRIQLIGLDDPSFFTSGRTSEAAANIIAQKLRELLQQDVYTILLSHRPEQFETYCDSGVNLVFCGHAHGGQIRLPWIGGVVAPNQGLFPEYTQGVFYRDETAMVVSRGLGNSIFPFRVNNPPEVVIVKLHSQS